MAVAVCGEIRPGKATSAGSWNTSSSMPMSVPAMYSHSVSSARRPAAAAAVRASRSGQGRRTGEPSCQRAHPRSTTHSAVFARVEVSPGANSRSGSKPGDPSDQCRGTDQGREQRRRRAERGLASGVSRPHPRSCPIRDTAPPLQYCTKRGNRGGESWCRPGRRKRTPTFYPLVLVSNANLDPPNESKPLPRPRLARALYARSPAVPACISVPDQEADRQSASTTAAT